MTPADQHALREALAREIYDWEGKHLGPSWTWDRANAKERVEYTARSAAIIEGLFALHLAAEAENTRLKETVEAAREALVPFAAQAKLYEAGLSIYAPSPFELRRARSVLATIPPKENLNA